MTGPIARGERNYRVVADPEIVVVRGGKGAVPFPSPYRLAVGGQLFQPGPVAVGEEVAVGQELRHVAVRDLPRVHDQPPHVDQVFPVALAG